jgi:hypothetical protein
VPTSQKVHSAEIKANSSPSAYFATEEHLKELRYIYRVYPWAVVSDYDVARPNFETDFWLRHFRVYKPINAVV